MSEQASSSDDPALEQRRKGWDFEGRVHDEVREAGPTSSAEFVELERQARARLAAEEIGSDEDGLIAREIEDGVLYELQGGQFSSPIRTAGELASARAAVQDDPSLKIVKRAEQ
jgi:hypothetical protein